MSNILISVPMLFYSLREKLEWEDMKNEWGPFWELKIMLCSWRYPSQSVGAAFLCVAVSWIWIFTLDNGEWKMNGQTAFVGDGEGLRVWWYDHDDDDTVDFFRKAAGSWWIKLTKLFERITVFDTGYYMNDVSWENWWIIRCLTLFWVAQTTNNSGVMN